MRFQKKLFYGIIDRRKEYKREMEKTNRKYQAYIQILKEELHPAMGCTEPIALAYAAAVARRELGCLPDRVVIGASGSIIKNVKSVIVPNTNHLKGIPAAVSAGIVAGDPDKELEVIAEATEEDSAKIKDFLENTPITVEHLDQGITFDIVVTLYHGDEYAKVRIANYHTNIVLIEHNGEVVKESEVKGEEEEGLTDRSLLNMKDIWDFINTVDVEEIKEVLDRQMEYNYTIAKEGIRGDYGANIGKVLLDMDDDNVKTRAKAMAAAGSDARMNGCDRQCDQTIFCNDIGNVFLIVCRTGIQHICIHDLFNRLGFTAGQQFFYVNLPDQMTLFCYITGINRLPVETNLSYF